MTTTKKVEILDSAGLRPSEIGKILGISPNFASVTLSKLRKRGEESATASESTTTPTTA